MKSNALRVLTIIVALFAITVIPTFAGGPAGPIVGIEYNNGVYYVNVDGPSNMVVTINGAAVGSQPAPAAPAPQPTSGTPVVTVNPNDANKLSCSTSFGAFVCNVQNNVPVRITRSGELDLWRGFAFPTASCAGLSESGDSRRIRCEANTVLGVDKFTFRPY